MNFEPNRGQAYPRFDFVSHGDGYSLLLAPGEAFLQLLPRAGHSAAVRIQILGANPNIHGRALQPQPGKSAYFIGNDPVLWRTDIPQYGRVEYDQIYPGVDVTYYGQGRQLEYDFVLGPHANSRQIQLKIEGADQLQIDDAGDLVLTVGGSQIRQRRPVVYQDSAAGRKLVEARYVRLGRNRVGFQLARYDSRKALVIDPALIFSTYFGGTGTNSGNAVALDASGNIYMTGQVATSPHAGALIGPVFTGGGVAAFLAKISPSGALLSTTYIGGAYDTQASGTSVALDSNGNIYIVGLTNSASFPTVNAIQAAYEGGVLSAFVLELNNAANALIFSTFLGGSSGDYAEGVNVDSAGNIYVGGTTIDGPISPSITPDLSRTAVPSQRNSRREEDRSSIPFSSAAPPAASSSTAARSIRTGTSTFMATRTRPTSR